MQQIRYITDDKDLNPAVFLSLVNSVWPGEYQVARTQEALRKTINFTAWEDEELIGCARILTDGYFFSTMPEVLVNPAYQKQGIGAELMKLVWKESPSSLSFGVQAGNEPFFEKLGYERGLHSYRRKKDRNEVGS